MLLGTHVATSAALTCTDTVVVASAAHAHHHSSLTPEEFRGFITTLNIATRKPKYKLHSCCPVTGPHTPVTRAHAHPNHLWCMNVSLVCQEATWCDRAPDKMLHVMNHIPSIHSMQGHCWCAADIYATRLDHHQVAADHT
jgi:hypothetical protein